MHSVLRRLDLNLLLVFDALYRNASVVAAADELALSPSAFSHALARLRASLADDLFVRTGNIMTPTPVAHELANPIAQALNLLSDGLGSSEAFDPSTSQQAFTFAATDYTLYAVLTPLVARLGQSAPNIKINVVYLNKQERRDQLRDGRVHFAIDARHAVGDGLDEFDTQDFFTDTYAVAYRRGHPRIKQRVSLKQYLAENHIAALPWNDADSVIDIALSRQGHRRNVVISLPSILAAPHIVAASNYLFTLPQNATRLFSDVVPITVCPVPFEVPEFTLCIASSPRFARSRSQQWMRTQLALAFATR
ncbi:LysR family transcriptional regulator [Pseudomonas capsici]|uniref:LysR family transcriptional regulator n=1 Tax=Pseudomonas capsici TaxID=2810614 RepID=UPI0021F12F88|nr:LysR family transcriptional regulator [Pseudomonas capsici]MCV4290453.1 LysR family transcriptional regulator [Pseudomonas capsici]